MMGSRRPRTAHEAALLERARARIAAGVRNTTASPDYAMVVKEARGSRIWDVSGNEYVDYLLGSGPMLLGHAHPAVVTAVREAVERGSSYLLVNEPAIELAEEIVRAVPCAETVSFHSTGSEATFFALRLARAFRRRDTILKFEGGFHGMSDYALMSNQWTRAPRDLPLPTPNSAGIPPAVADTVLVAPFNDLEATTAIIERHHDELAGVIVEPLQRTVPPRPGFLQGLRDVTRRYDIPLIFDEIVTGFRLAYGGAQEYYGVVPDLCALGKSLSAGHPIAVVCGRADIMAAAEMTRLGSDGYVALSGTYSANPISSAVALAALHVLREPGTYDRLFATGRQLMDGLRRLLAAAGIAAHVTGEPPAFEVWFTDGEVTDFRTMLRADARRHARFVELLLARGIMKGHEKFFVSTAHTDEDVALTLAAAREGIALLPS
jgi:glutamate-1-semialdehyde 2,1-aminomutase